MKNPLKLKNKKTKLKKWIKDVLMENKHLEK